MAKSPRRRAGQTLVCGWCSGAFVPADRGRTPKWCSQTCRQRAWELRRAARSGLVAIDVVQQVVEVEKVVTKEVVQEVAGPLRPSRRAWPALLTELTHQVERGLVYDRDLPDLVALLTDSLEVVQRRPGYRRHLRRQRDVWRKAGSRLHLIWGLTRALTKSPCPLTTGRRNGTLSTTGATGRLRQASGQPDLCRPSR